MTPYTPATVETIRAANAAGQSRHRLLRELGWDDAMLDRVCRRHGIDVAQCSAAPATQVGPSLAEQVLKVRRRDVRPKNTDRVAIGIDISALARARLEYRVGTRSISRYLADLLHVAKIAGFPNWQPYRGNVRDEYVTAIVTHDERLSLIEAAARYRCPGVSPFCAAIIEQHLVDDGLTLLRREA